jgi:hypothetical protein
MTMREAASGERCEIDRCQTFVKWEVLLASDDDLSVLEVGIERELELSGRSYVAGATAAGQILQESGCGLIGEGSDIAGSAYVAAIDE